MPTTNPPKQIRDDEIDLRDLFNRIGNTLSKWFRAIGEALVRTIVFLLKNIIPLIISVIIGVGISYALKWITKPVYTSEITLRSNVVPVEQMISNLKQLTILLKEKNFNRVATLLSISPEKAKIIGMIEAFWIIDMNNDTIPDFIDYRNSHNVYDTMNVRMKDRFAVRVELQESQEIPQMKGYLFSYVDQNPVFRQQNELRLRMIDELYARLNYDIEQLDSLQKVKYFEETRNIKPEKGGQIFFLQDNTTQLLYSDIYNLFRRKQELDQEKNLYNEILTVINDFHQPVKRFNGGWYYGKIVIPLCFGLMLIWLIIRRNLKKLRKVFNRY